MRPVHGIWERLERSPGEVAAKPQIPVLRPVEIAPPAHLANEIGTHQRTNDQPVALDQALGDTLVGVTGDSGHAGLAKPVPTDVPHRRRTHISSASSHRFEVARLKLVISVQVAHPLGANLRQGAVTGVVQRVSVTRHHRHPEGHSGRHSTLTGQTRPLGVTECGYSDRHVHR